MKGAGAVPRVPLGPEQKALDPVRKKTPSAKSGRLSGKQCVSEPSRPQSREYPILDERVPGLIFDSLATVQAAIVSASQEMPYKTMRQVVALGDEEKRELTSAAQAVAAKHAAFFSQHKDDLELGAVLMAISAAKIDLLLSLIDQSNGSSGAAESSLSGEHVCSARAALGIALIVLAPLGLFALILVVEHLRRKSYVH